MATAGQDRKVPPLFTRDGLADLLPAITAIVDVQRWRYRFISNATQRLLGYPSERFLAGGLAFAEEIVHPDDWPTIEASLGRPADATNEKHRHYTYRARSAAGGWRWLQTTTATLERDAAGFPELVASVTVDVSDRMAVEAELRETEIEYRRLLETAREGIVTVSPEFRLTFANRRFARMVGYQLTELIGRPFAELVAAEDRASFEEHTRRRREGRSEEYDLRLLDQRGQRIHCRIAANPLPSADDTFAGALGMFTDISDEVETLERLRSTEARFRAFAQHADQALFMASPDLDRLLFLSEAWERISGAGLDLEAWPAGFQTLIHDQDRPTLDAWMATLRRGAPASAEIRLARKAGPPTWLAVRGFPIPGPDGRPQMVGGFIGDITAKRTAQEELATSHQSLEELVRLRTTELEATNRRLHDEVHQRRTTESFLRQLIDADPSFILVTDPRGRIVLINAAHATAHGATAADLEGRQYGALCPDPVECGRRLAEDQAVLAGNEPATLPERMLETPDGPRTIAATKRPIAGPDGQPAYVLLVATDVTEIRRTSRLLQESEKLAATGRMAARVAHEINNPLGGIRNAFQLVKSAVPPAHPHFHYAARIEREIDRIAAIVRQMFDLYRPAPATVGRVELGPVLEDVLTLLERSLAERRLDVTVRGPGSLAVEQPEAMVRPVLLNLLQNAIEASPDGGVIRIDAGERADGVELVVEDEGAGVAPDLGDRIFEPFFTTKSGLLTGGLGLGLPTARSLIEAMGGTIRHSSGPAGGARFIVFLPTTRPATRAE